MEFLIVALTGFIILLIAFGVFVKTNDPLSPVVVFSPFLAYVYMIRPMILLGNGSLQELYQPEQLNFVLLVNAAVLGAFVVGLISAGRVRAGKGHFRVLRSFENKKLRSSLRNLAILLGLISFFVFWSCVWYSGGPIKVFSERKPFLRSPIQSGYYRELTLLAYPAILLLAVSWQGYRLTFERIVVALLIAVPHLTMGTFGGRRGPAFLIIATLASFWVILRQKKPNYSVMMVSVLVLGLFLIALNELRGDLFKIQGHTTAYEVITRTFTSGGSNLMGDECVTGNAVIITAEHHGRFHWGRRYFTWFILRPIPSAVWPEKYEFLNMGWMRTHPGSCGFSDNDWRAAVNFVVAGGSAGGFVSDLWLEFSWLAVIPAFLIGRLYAVVWRRSLTRGGIWTLFYMEMLIVSIYLPAQNIEAWLYRLLLLGTITYLFWRRVAGRHPARPLQHQQFRPGPPQRPQPQSMMQPQPPRVGMGPSDPNMDSALN